MQQTNKISSRPAAMTFRKESNDVEAKPLLIETTILNDFFKIATIAIKNAVQKLFFILF